MPAAALAPLVRRSPTSGVPIARVLLVGAEVEMIWSHAQPGITAMIHLKTCRYVAIGEKPGDAVGHNHSSLGHTGFSVAAALLHATPEPTALARILVYLLPEPLVQGTAGIGTGRLLRQRAQIHAGGCTSRART